MTKTLTQQQPSSSSMQAADSSAALPMAPSAAVHQKMTMTVAMRKLR
jgi:hypothetical protein